MTEMGHGVRVVTLEDGHYKLNEEELRQMLMNDAIKDLPVVVVSVAGAFRGGKSFLLNFFLRYLSSPESARVDGSWIGDENKELQGFSWRGGSERNTTGILMWSEPFVMRDRSGKSVAIFLMDTQGTYDSSSTIRDCSTVFALSTLLSSVQIYNLSSSIKEDDLQDLELFTDYGKLMQEQTGKAFQVLEFLIRDWMSEEEYPYGEVGGQAYLANKLKTTDKQPKELQKLRKHILDSFEKVKCFLMPHPGLTVGKSKFKGKLSEITTEFKDELKELASSIFSQQNLVVKVVGGQPVKSRELFTYFKLYMTIFNSDKVPSPKTIFETTSEAGLLMAYNEARDQFEHNMTLACGTSEPSMTVEDVSNLHSRELAAARATFKARKLFGDRDVINKKLETLTQELENRKKEYLEINDSKTMRAKANALQAYESAIKEVSPSGPELICVHASDVKKVYDYAKAAAIKEFDEHRKKPINGIDTEREEFINGLNSRYKILRLTNKQNNNALAVELKSEYFQTMVLNCSHDPKLSNAEFEQEHQKALKSALDKFMARRNGNDDILKEKYEQDPFKYDLETSITFQYNLVKQINVSNNTGSFQEALTVYYSNPISLTELQEHCYHPDDLENEHKMSMCNALQAFRKTFIGCGRIDFNMADRDEALLKLLFENDFRGVKSVNLIANEKAEELGYWAFKQKFDALTDYWYYRWFGISQSTRKQYLNEAKVVGLETFYGKRRDRNPHDKDSYLSNLESRAKQYAQVKEDEKKEDDKKKDEKKKDDKKEDK